MTDVIGVLTVLLALAIPGIAMPLMWVRMKQVRKQTYDGREQRARETPWQEPLEPGGGARTHAPNDDLIALGDTARHGRWPLDNQ